jgi:hypothetical protein
MKKTLLLLTLFAFTMANAQLSISPNQATINSGVVTITYGAGNPADWSLYNPNSDPNLYLYTGLDTDGDPATWEYHDNWNDLATLVPLTWNATANAYIATVNIGTRNYIQESSGTSMALPSGITVSDWLFKIRKADGLTESATLKGSTFGFKSATLSNNSFNASSIEFSIANGKAQTNAQGKCQLEIFAIDGKKVSSIEFENNSSSIEIAINLNEKGVYIAKLNAAGSTKVVKFIN